MLEWAQSLECPHDDPRVNLSNQAVESYLSGLSSRRALRNVAYVTDGLRYESAGEVMAHFAALVALAAGPGSKCGWEGLLNEASMKAAEYGIQQDDSDWSGVEAWASSDESIDPDFPDAHRWSPAAGEAEMAAWESLLGQTC